MSNQRQRLGERGENIVAAYLVRAGQTILDRNWRHKLGELDIVAQAGAEIVFVEVRTRRGSLSSAIEAAIESINPRKQERLIKLAEAYLALHEMDRVSWRVDVAAVGIAGDRVAVKVIENAISW